ncbi:MAG: DNA polymerase III subunit gamma/tau [Bacteroidota bacterium]
MENFVVSARKYRPAVFDHVLGQSHITTTLKNAIQENHLAQAFLFCGPRGVGKTTCARILAKTINCEQVTENIEPCNTCASCTSFNSNRSLNIYEIDAASNNSVEDIRTLVEQVRYAPQAGKYKVYIIDEVHMLSNAAFNAFLKTLEEPPSYAIFILATTEKHKIIPTILSRCQIFDFHRIQPQHIVAQLKYIARQESIAYEEEALYVIGQKADGALRDALSIFDLIVTFASGGSVSLQATHEHLHILDYTYYFKLTDACLQSKPGAALLLYDEILKAGFDGQHFITGLCEHFRNLMVSQDTATLHILDVADSVKKQYQTQAARAGSVFLFKALNIANQCDLHYKNSNNKRLHVEVALIALAHIQETSQLANDKDEDTTQQPNMGASPEPLLKSPSTKDTKQKNDQKHSTNPSTPLPDNKANTLQTTVRVPQIEDLKKSLTQQKIIPATQPTKQMASPLPVTQEAVRRHWHAYAKKLKLAGKMSEYSLLNQDVSLTGTTIAMQLVNAVQQDTLAEIQEPLMAYMRQNLQCANLALKVTVVAPQKRKKPYTAQEKFGYLAEKYPDLRVLQEKLSLEVQD